MVDFRVRRSRIGRAAAVVSADTASGRTREVMMAGRGDMVEGEQEEEDGRGD
jgi:hypothetical protein